MPSLPGCWSDRGNRSWRDAVAERKREDACVEQFAPTFPVPASDPGKRSVSSRRQIIRPTLARPLACAVRMARWRCWDGPPKPIGEARSLAQRLVASKRIPPSTHSPCGELSCFN